MIISPAHTYTHCAGIFLYQTSSPHLFDSATRPAQLRTVEGRITNYRSDEGGVKVCHAFTRPCIRTEHGGAPPERARIICPDRNREQEGRAGSDHRISAISYFTIPREVFTSTLSPFYRVKNALPKGDSLEILPSVGSASSLPTIR